MLGPLEAVHDGMQVPLGSRKQRALLAILLLRANEVVAPDSLIDELWGERPPPSAAHTLQVYVSRLRSAFRQSGGDDGVLVTRPAGYLLRVGFGELDLHRFEHLAEEGRRALASGSPERAAERLREALALWRGDPLADLAFEPFARIDVERLEELRLAALEDRIDADLALGRHTALVPETERLVAQYPLRERLRGQLMLALYRARPAGRRADRLSRDARLPRRRARAGAPQGAARPRAGDAAPGRLARAGAVRWATAPVLTEVATAAPAQAAGPRIRRARRPPRRRRRVPRPPPPRRRRLALAGARRRACDRGRRRSDRPARRRSTRQSCARPPYTRTPSCSSTARAARPWRRPTPAGRRPRCRPAAGSLWATDSAHDRVLQARRVGPSHRRSHPGRAQSVGDRRDARRGVGRQHRERDGLRDQPELGHRRRHRARGRGPGRDRRRRRSDLGGRRQRRNRSPHRSAPRRRGREDPARPVAHRHRRRR